MNFFTAHKTSLLALCILGLTGFYPAKATSTYTFATVNSANTSQSWIVNGLTLTATGYYDPNAPTGVTSPNTNPTGNALVNLYYNSTGDGAPGSATAPGLGLTSNVLSVNHTIPNNGFVQLHFSALVSTLNLTVVGVTDNWFVFGSNTAGQLGTVLYATTVYGTDGSFKIPIGPGYSYYDLISSQDCESLLQSVTVTPGSPGSPTSTPEPATSALIGGALLSFGLVLGRLRRNKA